MKISTVLGTRPQFVKAAAVSREFAKYDHIKEVIIHTGQHYDQNMSNIFFEQLHIPKPDYNLNINSLKHGAMTGQMLENIEEVLISENPDWLLVYGDTNSTLAGALAAKKLHIKIAHVEAGLRSFNMLMPEEINRILTDRISNILFCPTDTAVVNLEIEGFNNIDCKITNSGDVMKDAAIYYSDMSRKPEFNLPDTYILTTIHRPENTDDPRRLTEIFDALNFLSKNIAIILPLHPRTKQFIQKYRIKLNFSTCDPVGYLEMVYLLQHCDLVMTDSGGLQKEAFFFEKPCITLRNETEWVELVDNKFNILAGANKGEILKCFDHMFGYTCDFNINLYGEGNSSRRIVRELW